MKRIALLTASLICLMMFTTGRATAQQKTPDPSPSACLDSVPAWMSRYKIPVVAASVFEDGKIKQLKLFGRLGNGKTPPINTLFNVASLTKPITALTALSLVDAGKWDLDEPLDKYWIDPDIMGDPRHTRLTTRLILSHQTGFPNWRSSNPDKKLAFLFDPGAKFGYSGEGYEYLRHALEHKFGRTLQQLADSALFKPLGMRDTRYGWDKKLDSNLFAEPHDKNGERIKMTKIDQVIAADWLVTTIGDYSKFALSVLNATALSPKLYTDMVTPQVKMENKPLENMGLGWEVMTPLSNGEYLLMHTGSDDGVKTLAILFPRSKKGIILFTNSNNGFELIIHAIKEAFHLKELTP